jgi:hypothetical protein
MKPLTIIIPYSPEPFIEKILFSPMRSELVESVASVLLRITFENVIPNSIRILLNCVPS